MDGNVVGVDPLVGLDGGGVVGDGDDGEGFTPTGDIHGSRGADIATEIPSSEMGFVGGRTSSFGFCFLYELGCADGVA